MNVYSIHLVVSIEWLSVVAIHSNTQINKYLIYVHFAYEMNSGKTRGRQLKTSRNIQQKIVQVIQEYIVIYVCIIYANIGMARLRKSFRTAAN